MRTKQACIDVSKRRRTEPKWRQLLSDFDRSKEKQLELIPDPDEYKSLKVAQSVACTAIRRYGFNMSTIRENGRLYLVKDLVSQTK